MCRFVPFVPWTGRSAPRRGLPPSSEPSSPRFEAGARFSIGPAAVGARRRAGSDRRGRAGLCLSKPARPRFGVGARSGGSALDWRGYTRRLVEGYRDERDRREGFGGG